MPNKNVLLFCFTNSLQNMNQKIGVRDLPLMKTHHSYLTLVRDTDKTRITNVKLMSLTSIILGHIEYCCKV